MKKIFTLFAVILCATSAWAWCGNSFITVNGKWYTGSNSYKHDEGYFNGANLGDLTTLVLGGELQVYPKSGAAATLCYKIDDGGEKSISLPKTGEDGNNSKHSGSGKVDLSALSGGEHTISVWFKHNSDYDSNNSKNFVAKFNIPATAPDRYITGTIAGGWDGNEVKMTYDEKTQTYSHTFAANKLSAGVEYKLKVTGGNWDYHCGTINGTIPGVLNDGEGNVCFTLKTVGDVTISFQDAKITVATTGEFKVPVTYEYYILGTMNSWSVKEDYGLADEDNDGIYTREITLTSGQHDFKINVGNWDSQWGWKDVEGNYSEATDAKDDNKIKITLTAEKTFTVLFNTSSKKITFEGLTQIHTVKATVNPAEAGTIKGLAADGKYNHGAEATLTAAPAEGYEFTCWTAGKDTVSTANPYTFTVSADVALVANFKKSVVTHDFYVENVTVTEGQWSIDLSGSWNEQAFVMKLWQDNTQGFGTYAANAETGYTATLGVKELTPTAEGYYMQDPMNENAFIFQGTMTDGTDIYEVYLKGALASSTGTGEMEAKDDVAFSCDADGAWTIEAYADDMTWGLYLEVAQNPETTEWIAAGYYITNPEAEIREEVEGTGLLYFDDFSGCQVFRGTLTTESGEIYPTLYASSLTLMTNELMTGASWVGEFADVDYYEVYMWAADDSWNLDLHARNCTGANGTYTIDVVDEAEGAYSTFMGNTIVTGELTIEDGSYEASLTTLDAEGVEAMSISLSAWKAEATEYNVVITNATVTENTSGYYIDMIGEWDGHTIKVEVCDELTAETILANFFIDGGIMNDGDQAEGTVEATVNEGVVTITGTFECLGSGAVYNVTISGTLPGGTTTALDNLNTTVAPVKMIENGQLIIVKDGVQYNAQGAILK